MMMMMSPDFLSKTTHRTTSPTAQRRKQRGEKRKQLGDTANVCFCVLLPTEPGVKQSNKTDIEASDDILCQRVMVMA
jgi:hypothetical protein